VSVRVGMRLRCEQCGSEAIVTTAGDAQLECCNSALTDTSPAPAPASEASDA
jgi:hypothetical protein